MSMNSKIILNFALFMKATRIAGLILLGLVWLWLGRELIAFGGGVTLKNIFVIVASGIIIFVPLYKKYFRQNED